MRSRAVALAVAIACAGCKNDAPPVADTQDTPHLPPVDYAGKGSGSGSGGMVAATGSGSGSGGAKPSGAGLPPVTGLPPVSVGSGSAMTGSAATGSAPTPTPTPTPTAGSGSGSASAPTPTTGSASASGSGSGSGASGSSDDRKGGSVATSAPTSDCDVTVGLTDTTATWTGGASGSAAIASHLGKLTESVKPLDDMACRIIVRADADIRYDAVIAVLEAAYAARPFKMSIMMPDGGRLNASPPTSGAAGTAVRDATPIVIDKKGIKVGATIAAGLDDADIPSKVSAGLSAAQQTGTRGIMVTLKAEGALHYKLLGAVLTGVKSAGFVTVLFQ